MCSIICNTGLFGSVRETFNINPVFFLSKQKGSPFKVGVRASTHWVFDLLNTGPLV